MSTQPDAVEEMPDYESAVEETVTLTVTEIEAFAKTIRDDVSLRVTAANIAQGDAKTMRALYEFFTEGTYTPEQ